MFVKQIFRPWRPNVERRYMRTRNLALTLICATLLLLCGCHKELSSATGKVTLITDWSNRTQGVDIPSRYKIVAEGQAITLSDTRYTLSRIIPGTYDVLVYNTPDKITIDQTTVTVNTEQNTVTPNPGWLFTYADEVTFEAGKESVQAAIMTQQVRQLNFIFALAGNHAHEVQKVTAVLTGVANQMNFKTNTYAGTDLSVTPILTREENKLLSTVHLLGVIGTQKLILTVKYSNGREQTVESDISEMLAKFNQRKYSPLTLFAQMEITHETDFEASVDKWQIVEGSSGTAN